MSNYYLIYMSKANRKFTTPQLLEMLTYFRGHNLRHNITGALLYRNGFFLQILEGEKPEVTELYESILYDNRHSNVVKMIDGTYPVKQFTDWSMAFDDLSGVESELSDQFDAVGDNPTLAHRLLGVYRESLN